MNYLIREYKSDDKDQVVELMREFGIYMQDLDPLKRTIFKDGADEYFVDKMIQTAQNKEGLVLLAEINKEIVGFIEGHIENLSDDDQQEIVPTKIGKVSELFVTSSSRASGLGSDLMNRMETYFKSKKCDYFTIQVFAPNKIARNFYEKMGFVERGINLGKKI